MSPGFTFSRTDAPFSGLDTGAVVRVSALKALQGRIWEAGYGDSAFQAQMANMPPEQRRMMEEVPNADVVITNPTHYAVALQGKRGSGRAPGQRLRGQPPAAPGESTVVICAAGKEAKLPVKVVSAEV